jgi:D-beta-D-heptose 7-phosphate kinase / D-beta-D-heptose 1-phosphate adenosyltransferase
VTVGINAQSYLDGKYGSAAVALDDRIFVLESNRWVDEVIVFEEDTPSELISRLRPKYYVKGPDYKGVRLPEDAALLEVGTTLLIRPGIREYSSTELVSSKA